MIILVSGATATLRQLPSDAPIGHLYTPRAGNDPAVIFGSGRVVAADNDCFNGLDRVRYLRMLRRLQPYADRIAWLAAPDVVGDAAATLARWRLWTPTLRYYGYRLAYVAQDGSEVLPPPWGELDCLFVGGTTAWKENRHAAALAHEAKQRGKWLHVGRVNTVRRLRLIDNWQPDSIDGTQFSRFAATYLPRWCQIVGYRQHHLWSNQ